MAEPLPLLAWRHKNKVLGVASEGDKYHTGAGKILAGEGPTSLRFVGGRVEHVKASAWTHVASFAEDLPSLSGSGADGRS
jgi:hypothetical protein